MKAGWLAAHPAFFVRSSRCRITTLLSQIDELASACSPKESMFQADLLRGKRCLITGGGTGLGKAMARRFLQLGAVVFICGRREQVLREAQQELSAEAGGRIQFHKCDVRYEDEV